MKLEWSSPALDDLETLRLYIARDSAHYARQFIERIFAAVESLTDFPDLGRSVPEVDDPAIRELSFRGYRIIYKQMGS